MNDLLITALWLSLSGSIFILVLYLCKPIVRHKLSKGWQYYIWLIVIARLLLPFSLEVNVWSSFVGNLESRINTPTPQQEVDFEGLPDSITPNNNYDNILPPKTSNDQTNNSMATEMQTKSLAQQFADVCSVLLSNAWLIWFVVAVILLIRKITIYQSFIRYIKAGRIEVSDIEHLELLGKLSEQLKIKRIVGLYANGLIASPILIGFFNPCIILPTTELSDVDFRNTILHELMHYKRFDMFYKWLVQLTICLHWFNPLVYLMGREINRACELSCDEASLRTLNLQEQKAYGDTLLNVLVMGKYNQQIASLSLNEGKELMKERLDSIMNFKKNTWLVRCTMLVVTFVFLCVFAVTGAYAAGNDNQKQSYISRTDSLKQNFERYKAFGVTYNPTQDAVYYNGERVKLFVEFKSNKEEGMAYVFDFSHHDSKTNSTLYLEAVKDSSGKITEIRRLETQIANELLVEQNASQLNLPTFSLIDAFSYAGSFQTNKIFMLENDTTIEISTKISVEEGGLNLTIQPMRYGYYHSNGNVYDADGKIGEIVYQANCVKGKKVDETKSITLKAGEYYVSLKGSKSPVKNARWEIIGTSAKEGSTPWLNMGNGDGQSYVYSQTGYYHDGYVFEMGWNLYENGYIFYPDKTTLTLADKSKVTVSFDATCKNSIKQPEALTALSALLYRLKTQSEVTGVPLEKPLVVSVEYVGNKDVNKLAEEYYNNGEITSLSAIFFALDKKTQQFYFDKMFDDGEIALFSAILKTNEIGDDMVHQFAQKAYSEEMLTFFSVLVPYMTDSEQQAWVVKSSQDKRVTFLSVLKEKMVMY